MSKRTLLYSITALFVLYFALDHWGLNRNTLHLHAEAVELIDAQTGQILYAKNEKKRMYPASTTKIMTAMIALEKGDLQDRITVGDEVDLKTYDESSADLQEGQVLTLRELLNALLLPSGNDAARTIARYVAEKTLGKTVSAQEGIAYFAGLMNAKAEQIGANDSHFVNPHGLQDPQHYTTANDLAIIAKAAMQNDVLRQIVDETKHKTVFAASTKTYINTNKLLQEDSLFFFQGANGIKTGFTDEAGHCLVSSASRNGHELIAVVLHSTEDGVWTDSQKLLDYGFAQEREMG